MVAAIKQFVTVGPDGVIQVRSPHLKPGSRAEVIILVPDQHRQGPTLGAHRSLTSFIGAGRGAFEGAADIDRAIRELRDWGDRDR